MMRMRAAAAVAILGLLGLSAQAQTLYVTEPFSVASGNLAGQGSGIGWSGSWSAIAGTIDASPGTGQTYGSLVTSGNSVSSSSTTAVYSRTIAAAATLANDYWVSFLIRTNAGSNQYAGLDLGGNLYIGKASTDSSYGIATTGNPADNVSHPTGPTGGTDLLVAHFRATGANTGAIDLYVNPTSLGGAAPGTGFVTANLLTQAPPDLAGTALRLFSGSLAGGGPLTSFSDIRIGDSFAAVTPVPEPLTVGLAAAAGLGLVRLRRRVL